MRKRFFGRGTDAEGQEETAGRAESPTEDAAENEELEGAGLDGGAEGEVNEEDGLPTEGDLTEAEPDQYSAEDVSAESEADSGGDQIIAQLRAEAEENYDKYLRAVAELENYKKRAIKERSDLIKYAGEYLARDILDVLDNLERALSHAESDNREEVIKGVRMVRDQFVSVLERHNIAGFSGLGEPFDPGTQEAMLTAPSTEYAPGVVMNEFRKAYFFKDKLIRPAQVVVAAAPPEGVAPEGRPDQGEGEESA